MAMNVGTIKDKRALPLLDLEDELAAFEREERKRLGMADKTEHWVEDMAGLTFTKKEKAHLTILVSGLTVAHDYFVEGGLRGVGYHVQAMDGPDVAALQFGKEFGNRGQCNPTYFTVGNLVKFLCTLRDTHGMTTKEIIDGYVFLTAGACGPCRFGMYVTEYRKALRDAGFDGFRVVLFQQTGGLSQATGEESGLEMNPKFFWAIVKALIAGDVINALGYRIRPYEVNAGDTDRALEQCKKIIYRALESRSNIVYALWQCKPILEAVKVDRTRVRPKVSIIGEFWAMTTEGDGNYQLQRFLESEGAEPDVQTVTSWLLYLVWEARRDTEDRMTLRGSDPGKYGLKKLGQGGTFGIGKKLIGVRAADKVIRGLFQSFAHAAGLYDYHLPDMFEIARISNDYYSNDLRGGEGHMEVGKLIMNVVHSKAHMTLSVKPFGCMPSAGVSDGVQTAISELFPGTIFCPVETSGDGRVNFYSRVQMYLFKAKQAAAAELDQACAEHGVTLDQVRLFLEANPRFASPLHKAKHVYAGTTADLVAEVAACITQSPAKRLRGRAEDALRSSTKVLRQSPRRVGSLVEGAVRSAPGVVSRLKEDVALYRELGRSAPASSQAVAVDVAAE